ncbi:MAG: hypothetical protein IKK85_04440 [Clostridia bacterium]|nr:hypothetical protein [Clostridia bacterium]
MAKICLDEEKVFDMVYKAVGRKATSNTFIQSISGIVGCPATLFVDGLVIFTHYEPMINDIRDLYGRTRISSKDFSSVASCLFKEILVDIAIDKVMGQIPVAGIYFNAISAQALTWRLGMVTTILSARGDTLNNESVSDVVRLVRCLTQQTDMFKFTKPDYETFKKIVLSVDSNDHFTFNSKVKTALKAFE